MVVRYAVMRCKRCGLEWPDEVPVGEHDWTFWPVCRNCGFLRPRVRDWLVGR